MKGFFLLESARKFRSKRANWLCLAFVAGMLLMHHLSIGWMAKSRCVELIMAGAAPDCFTAAMVIGFVALRIATVLFLPGFLLSWICPQLLELLLERLRRKAASPAPKES